MGLANSRADMSAARTSRHSPESTWKQQSTHFVGEPEAPAILPLKKMGCNGEIYTEDGVPFTSSTRIQDPLVAGCVKTANGTTIPKGPSPKESVKLRIDIGAMNPLHPYTEEVVPRQARPLTPYPEGPSALWTPCPTTATLEAIREEEDGFTSYIDDASDCESFKSLGTVWSMDMDSPRRFNHRDSLSLDRAKRLRRPRGPPKSKLPLPRRPKKVRQRRHGGNATVSNETSTESDTSLIGPQPRGGQPQSGIEYPPNPMFAPKEGTGERFLARLSLVGTLTSKIHSAALPLVSLEAAIRQPYRQLRKSSRLDRLKRSLGRLVRPRS
ncbi:hypothetical protein GQ53DRAFT_47837 [Thozetella sp. PMI_491]|nr:hypothetical protein GQ53DRAFT_47837 [Thozetella sp. PMI_491]